MISGYLHLENRKIPYGNDLGPFRVLTLFGAQQLQSLKTLEPAVIGVWEWDNFGSQKVRSVINGTIFNRSASNLVCAHDFWLSPPGKQERPILAQFFPILGQ